MVFLENPIAITPPVNLPSAGLSTILSRMEMTATVYEDGIIMYKNLTILPPVGFTGNGQTPAKELVYWRAYTEGCDAFATMSIQDMYSLLPDDCEDVIRRQYETTIEDWMAYSDLLDINSTRLVVISLERRQMLFRQWYQGATLLGQRPDPAQPATNITPLTESLQTRRAL